jgi:outer membrane protein assembly factor BamB
VSSSIIRRFGASLGLSVFTVALVFTMWAADWPMPGGNPQRNGWAGSERQITKANVGTLKLLYKYQTDNTSRGLDSLVAPIINGNLITYLGFKEMLIFSGSSDRAYSVDADLNKLIWETRFPYAATKPMRESSTAACSGGLTAPVVMAGSSSSPLHFAALASRAPAATGVRPARPNPYLPPLSQSVYPLLPTTLTQLNALYAVSSDGYLHVLNSSTGEDLIPSFRFIPPNAKVTSLNLRDNVVYATTADNCDGYLNALYAIDILSPEKTVRSFVPSQGEFAGTTGSTIGNDGTVYVQAAYPKSNDAKHVYETVVALTPRELKVKDYFTMSDKPLKSTKSEAPGISPVVFSFPARDLVVAGSSDGRIFLLDSRSLGGADHQTPLFVSKPMAESGRDYNGSGFRGVFSTWLDVETGTRRLYASAFGGLNSPAGQKKPNSAAESGGVVALELKGMPERPILEQIWVSPKVVSPAPPVIANGMVFVLSTGEPSRTAKRNGQLYSISEIEQLSAPATLHVFDAMTGKELYSGPGAPVSAAPSSGLAVANGRAYFSARDNAVYCFGIPGQHTQLTQQ